MAKREKGYDGGAGQCLQVLSVCMQAVGFIILSNLPGQNKLKNIKYFLGQGDNVVGCDPRCQIAIPQRYDLPHYAANIRTAHSFLTIEALHPHLVYVQANLSKARQNREIQADHFFPLAPGLQYVPRLGEFFYLGRVKVVIGSGSSAQLLQMSHILNRSMFASTLNRVQIEELPKNIINEIPTGRNESEFDRIFGTVIASEPVLERILVNSEAIEQNQDDKKDGSMKQRDVASQRSKTEQLEGDQYQATLVLDEGIYANEPTINLDYPEPPPQPHYSQEQLMHEIRRRSQQSRSQQPQEDEIDYSMPDTIVDKPEQASPSRYPQLHQYQQVQSREEMGNDDDDMDMPPTIKEEDEAPIGRIKPSKTMVNHEKPEKQELNHNRLYKSERVSKTFSNEEDRGDQKPIEDFMDLFGMSEPAPLKHTASQPPKDPLALMNCSGINQPVSLPEQEKQQKSVKQAVHYESARVDIVGFKPTAAHKQFLKEQKLELVNSPREQYELLIVKQPLRVCNKLLMALLNGKRIESEQWIFNKQAEIQSKLNGHTWRSIFDCRGTHGTPLKGKGRFYVSKRLHQLLDGVIEHLGGELTDQLVDRKRVINVILRVDDSQDTETYLQHRDNKKWRFIKSEAIVECVFTGKYVLDQKYLIHLTL